MSSALAEGTVEAQQACYLPVSPDGLPVLGRVPGIEGAYIASGMCSIRLCLEKMTGGTFCTGATD